MKKALCSLFALTVLLSACAAKPAPSSQSTNASSVSESDIEEPVSGGASFSVSAVNSAGGSTALGSLVKVVIPEGYTLARIGMTLEEKAFARIKSL